MNEENRTARAALTRLFEPGDIVGRALVAKHGAHAALRIAIGARPARPFWDVTAEELAEGLSRWAPRIHDLDPEKDLATIERLGGGFLVPVIDLSSLVHGRYWVVVVEQHGCSGVGGGSPCNSHLLDWGGSEPSLPGVELVVVPPSGEESTDAQLARTIMSVALQLRIPLTASLR
jgi:hypothetical protein